MTGDELHKLVVCSHDAVGRLQTALDLPFRPVPLQPVADMFAGVNDLLGRIAELEDAMRKWRDHYAQDGDMTVGVPRYQIVALVGEKPANT